MYLSLLWTRYNSNTDESLYDETPRDTHSFLWASITLTNIGE